MVRVITVAHQSGSGGTQLASLIARKFGWELLEYHLVDRIARIAVLGIACTTQSDEQAARWWRRLRHAGMDTLACSSNASLRELSYVDKNFVHALATQLIQVAADFGECVVVGHGAQCLLRGREGVFHILAYAPINERLRALQARWPEHCDILALLTHMDSQRAEYVRQYYGKDWLDPMFYDLCVNTVIGLDRAATLITEAVVFPDNSRKPIEAERLSLCPVLERL